MSDGNLCQIGRGFRQGYSILPNRQLEERLMFESGYFAQAVIKVVTAHVRKVALPELLQPLMCDPPTRGIVAASTCGHRPMIFCAKENRAVLGFSGFGDRSRVCGPGFWEILLKP